MTEHVTLSIVIPFYNEETVLEECYARTTRALSVADFKYELIFVDDGSTDCSLSLVYKLPLLKGNASVKIIELSRNFGKEAAITAGLANTTGKCAIILDADLQDPPELIIDMIKEWGNGYEVVNMQRISRGGESLTKKLTSWTFYKIINLVSDVYLPGNVGDFRLIDRNVIDAINLMTEKNRYMKGILSWPGFSQKTLQYHREPRVSGDSKWTYIKLTHLALDGIFSFSTKPLRAIMYTSIILISISISLLLNDAGKGDNILTAIFAVGGINLWGMAILSGYIGRIFIEVKGRPIYIIKSTQG